MGEGKDDSAAPPQSGSRVPRETEGETPPEEILPKPPPELVEQAISLLQFWTGQAAQLGALTQLPENTQLKQLDNERYREQLQFDMEAKRLEAMRLDRQEERASRRHRFDQRSAAERRTESLHFIYVLLVTGGVGALVVALVLLAQYQLAIGVTASAISFGAGWIGGRSSGYSKARRESRLGRSDEESDD